MTDLLNLTPPALAGIDGPAPAAGGRARPGRTFEVRLPVGLAGDEGVHRDAVIRKMTGREEAILADRKFQRNGGKLVTELLAACTESIGGQPADRAAIRAMTSVDRNYLLIRLRAVTFGSELEARYTCPACGHVELVTEDLDELPVRQADGSMDCEVDLLDGYVDRDGELHTDLRLRLPDGSDEEAVASQMRDNASTGKNALLGRCIVSLGTVPRSRIEAMGSRILADLTLGDRRLIDRALAEAAPGVDLTRNLECPDCGHGYSANLDLSNFLSLA